MFHDVVSLLHAIGANAMTHKSALVTLKAQRDAKFETDLEARVFTSFRTSFPAILCGGSSAVESVEDHVRLEDRLKTYKVWYADDGTSGVSQRMLSGIVEIEKRVSRMAREVTRRETPLFCGLSTAWSGTPYTLFGGWFHSLINWSPITVTKHS